MTGTVPEDPDGNEAVENPSYGDSQPADTGSDGAKEDLQSSLAALAGLATGRLGLEEILTQVAVYAVRAIPGADGAGLTLIEADRADTIVATADFVREIDTIQYSMGRRALYQRGSGAQDFHVRIARR